MTITWTEQTGSGSRSWRSVCSSADGTKLYAVENGSGGYLYGSNNSGVSWTALLQHPSSCPFTDIACSSDGSRIIAGNSENTSGGFQYSNNSGASFTWYLYGSDTTNVIISADGTYILARYYNGSSGALTWNTSSDISTAVLTGDDPIYTVAMSNDASKMFLGIGNDTARISNNYGVSFTTQGSESKAWGKFFTYDGDNIYSPINSDYIYHSNNSGVSWTALNSGSRNWNGNSMSGSNDNTTLISAVNPGYIYVSDDSGSNFTEQTDAGSKAWNSVASSSDGTKFVAVVTGGYIWTGVKDDEESSSESSEYLRECYYATGFGII